MPLEEQPTSPRGSTAANKRFYDRYYSNQQLQKLANRCSDHETFMDHAKRTSWNAFDKLYFDDMEKHVAGLRVLELGFGRGLNTLLLAKYGASVVAVEISDAAVSSLAEAAKLCNVSDRVQAVSGDFAQMDFEPKSFDLIIAKSFLHHLTHEQEDAYILKAARLLKTAGEARFYEPAINIPLFDELRFWIPTKTRPSKWRYRAFADWKKREDRHPKRNNSSRHFRKVGRKYFDEVVIHPWGGFSRLLVFMPQQEPKYEHMRSLVKSLDERVPHFLQKVIARNQTIQMVRPKNA